MKFLIAILILAVILIAGCTGMGSNTEEVSTSTAQTQIYTGNTKDLLPTRNEINTEYRIVTTEDKTDIIGYYSNYQEKGLKATGFQNGSYMELEILEGNTITVGYINILKFDSVENANLFYSSLIDFIKNEGGYKEISSFGINADCFGIEGSYPDYPLTNYYQDFYCKKKNIFFNTEVSGYKKSRLSECKDWAQAITNKI